jgi:hypothetical protein
VTMNSEIIEFVIGKPPMEKIWTGYLVRPSVAAGAAGVKASANKGVGEMLIGTEKRRRIIKRTLNYARPRS